MASPKLSDAGSFFNRSTMSRPVFIGESAGASIAPVDVAKRRKTITNEVSTSFAARLVRVYTEDGVPVALRDLRGYHVAPRR